MSSCEKCWRDAHRSPHNVAEEYKRIMEERDDAGRQADENEDYHECEQYVDEAAFVSRRKNAPFTTPEMPDGYVYWVDIAE